MPFGSPRTFGSPVPFGSGPPAKSPVDTGPQAAPRAAIRLPNNQAAVYAAVRRARS